MLLKTFQKVGMDLFSRGLVSGSAGNLSVRMGEKLIITRRGTNLAHVEENDLIETGIDKNDRNTPLASSELGVHRLIYQNTPALSIVHAHPPHAIALSFTSQEIIPADNEGLFFAGQVPVLGYGSKVSSGMFGEMISTALKERRIVMVYAHGSFAIGQLLEEAQSCTASFEASCLITCIFRSMQLPVQPPKV